MPREKLTRCGRVERRGDRLRPMASAGSALSRIVANGHPIVPTVSPPPPFIPYGGSSPVRLEACRVLLRPAEAVTGCVGRRTSSPSQDRGASSSPFFGGDASPRRPRQPKHGRFGETAPPAMLEIESLTHPCSQEELTTFCLKADNLCVGSCIQLQREIS
jgi:hypothetical protein